MSKIKLPIAAVVAAAAGLVVLLGYFLPLPALRPIRDLLLNWAAILTGMAVLVGILNMVGAHWQRLSQPKNRDAASLVLVLAFWVTVAVGIWLSPAHPVFRRIITHIQMPFESSMMAVLSVTLTLAAARLLQQRRDLMSILFLVSAILFLALAAGLFNNPLMNLMANFLQQIPLAGARGILLGIALGSLVTGIRVLMGADRPYGE